MKFQSPLIEGKLIRRYKRFLADIELVDRSVETVHCANPGSMLGCDRPGSKVLLSRSPNPKRKLPLSWELIRIGRTWVGINTALTNAVVNEALNGRLVPELDGFDSIRSEVNYGANSRVDFLLEFGNRLCYVEVKNVTLAEGSHALFPDSITQRGTKHLNELAEMVKSGQRAVMFYLVNRQDCESMGPAAEIDPVYAETLAKVMVQGVEVLVYAAKVGKRGITVSHRIPFVMRET